MKKVSVIVPVYNVEKYVAQTIESVLGQTYPNFELLIVDDESPDGSVEICRQFQDSRIKIISQKNRGLAGARNTGIRNATGDYLAFLDSDDLWLPEKLERHVAHLDSRPQVGVSFSRSAFIDGEGNPLNYYQMPKLTGITTPHLLCRNPIGNGSAPVLRREVLEAIRFQDNIHGTVEDFYFDDRLRQSEDIECWIRISIKTNWVIEGIPEPLTLYRVNTGGLSASVLKQLASWEQAIEKTRSYAPDIVGKWGKLARAYQLRYLSRRAVQIRDAKMAIQLLHEALLTDPRIIVQEPQRTILTWIAAYVLAILPGKLYDRLEARGMRQVVKSQERIIYKGGNKVER